MAGYDAELNTPGNAFGGNILVCADALPPGTRVIAARPVIARIELVAVAPVSMPVLSGFNNIVMVSTQKRNSPVSAPVMESLRHVPDCAAGPDADPDADADPDVAMDVLTVSVMDTVVVPATWRPFSFFKAVVVNRRSMLISEN